MAGAWLYAYLAVAVAVLAAYAVLWPRRKDVSAYIYVHKGALWFIWLVSWAFLLLYLGAGPMAAGLARAVSGPYELARAMLSMLGILTAIYLTYLIIVYPFFASLRPSLSRESLGIEWQLDVHVEEKVAGLVEETPMAPLLLLDMGLAEALRETPPEERLTLLRSLWLQYVPVITGRQATGAVYTPDGEPNFVEPELTQTVRLALETMKITDNREDLDRRYNAVAMPLNADENTILVLAAYWTRRKPFKGLFNLLAQQFCTIRNQYILAEEVSGDRLSRYGSPWIDGEEGV